MPLPPAIYALLGGALILNVISTTQNTRVLKQVVQHLDEIGTVTVREEGEDAA